MNEQIFWLAVNIYHEARGEALEGQVAIGHVVMNRALAKHKSCKEIILQPLQFSWHNGNTFPPIADYGALFASIAAAEKVVEERLEGRDLSGADHYFNPHVVRPTWARNMTLIKRIGNHDFCKN